MGLKEIGCEEANWTRVVQDRDQWRALGNKVMNPRAP
jgi:hypothetical protein